MLKGYSISNFFLIVGYPVKRNNYTLMAKVSKN